MKLKARTKDCWLRVKAKLSFGEAIDQHELMELKSRSSRVFLAPEGSGRSIEYVGPIGVSLFDRFKSPVTKREFLAVIKNTAEAVENITENSRLSQNKLVADVNYVYINEVTKEVRFIYLPATINRASWNIIHFIDSVIYSATPDRTEKDIEYVSRFADFFQEELGGKFLPSRVKEYVAREEGAQPPSPRRIPSGEEFVHSPHGGGSGTTPVGGGGVKGGTVPVNRPPRLCRVQTGETVDVNKPLFHIGKEKGCADYFVADNDTVSRNHADIITRNNKYFIKDLNSTNGTFVNDQRVPGNYETELHDGDRVRLANETFEFRF